ncbi:internal head protein [Morganella phage vB_MmoM_MP1]|uniref:Uncharacterized protein n=1 Tax=Morganella phage vB_MmoM_MP1 TaxID=1852628 RepID=A0A192YBS2_9CAUD|nr:internal head protein [Morganella phage vB_MmoM_MP1]ANM46575.1 hypothetical protein MP1_gp0136 [Morganella phage vB_MmoM_MP1]
MKTFQEFINEALPPFPSDLDKSKTLQILHFGGERDGFEQMMKNGYTFLDARRQKITKWKTKRDLAYVETGKNSKSVIQDDLEDFDVETRKPSPPIK